MDHIRLLTMDPPFVTQMDSCEIFRLLSYWIVNRIQRNITDVQKVITETYLACSLKWCRKRTSLHGRLVTVLMNGSGCSGYKSRSRLTSSWLLHWADRKRSTTTTCILRSAVMSLCSSKSQIQKRLKALKAGVEMLEVKSLVLALRVRFLGILTICSFDFLAFSDLGLLVVTYYVCISCLFPYMLSDTTVLTTLSLCERILP